MFTNTLKKGDQVRLRNGFDATIMDNTRGNIRLAKVEGLVTETGSVYAHDIVFKHEGDGVIAIEYTPAQNKLRQRCKEFGM